MEISRYMYNLGDQSLDILIFFDNSYRGSSRSPDAYPKSKNNMLSCKVDICFDIGFSLEGLRMSTWEYMSH